MSGTKISIKQLTCSIISCDSHVKTIIHLLIAVEFFYFLFVAKEAENGSPSATFKM